MIIYKTTNLVNGKIYIGQDSNNNPNYLGSGKILHQAIEKYGIDRFQKDIIEECDSKEMLNEREIYWIDFHKSTNRNIGYNIALGGQGGDTISKHPDRDLIRQKHSEWMKENNPTSGRTRTEEEIEKWINSIGDKLKGKNNSNYGKHHSKETKEKQSQIRKEWWNNLSNEERIELANKISKSNIGKESPLRGIPNPKHSKWMKENNPMKGVKHSDNTRRKISEANAGKSKSEEHKQKISESLKGNKPGNMVKIEIEGIAYESLTEAYRQTGINISTLRNRIKSNNPKFVNYKKYE